jgi:tRNA(Ile)-lysidine synthase
VLKEFESNILAKELFKKKQKLLLAISAGADSVVLAHLLKDSGFNFSLAHCNFKLRGKESDADEKFCKDLAKKMGVKLYFTSFDTKAYCKKKKLNTQLAARELRYTWFHELINQEKFDFLLTAHHANDVMETFFINLLRGTGIKGLKGIPEKKGQIVRPLLNYTKEQIDAFAKKKKITYRVDKSNLEDKYERNFIRLNIIPLLKEINPNLEKTFSKNTSNLRQEAAIVNDYLEDRSTVLITQTPEMVFIDKKKLKHEKHMDTVLHHLISGYGFNHTQEKNILDNIQKDALVGKLFYSISHQLTIAQNDLIVKPLTQEKFKPISITNYHRIKEQNLILFKELKEFNLPKNNEMIVDLKRLIFPLTIRSKKSGDKFQPFGMKNFKLISAFLKDQKINAFEKENCKVLVNGNGDILWVIGHRSDERYRAFAKDKQLLKLEYVG